MNGIKRFGFESVAWSASMVFNSLPNMAFEKATLKVARPSTPRPAWNEA